MACSAVNGPINAMARDMPGKAQLNAAPCQECSSANLIAPNPGKLLHAAFKLAPMRALGAHAGTGRIVERLECSGGLKPSSRHFDLVGRFKHCLGALAEAGDVAKCDGRA